MSAPQQNWELVCELTDRLLDIGLESLCFGELALHVSGEPYFRQGASTREDCF